MAAITFEGIPPHVSPERAARALRVGRTTLYRYLKKDNCPRFGGRYYITPEWLERVALRGVGRGQ